MIMPGGNTATLQVLLMEDDQEDLELLLQLLPESIAGYAIEWEKCEDFEDAVKRVTARRYDLIVTDIYRDRRGVRKGVDASDEKAREIIGAIRSKRFCPIVAFTNGSSPQTFTEGPFVKLADKSKGADEIIARIEEMLATGVPAIARKLHDELDREAGSYLWDFLEQHWERLCENGPMDINVLERMVRRRAAIQLGRLDSSGQELREVSKIEGLEFYIYPPVSESPLRLGDVLRQNSEIVRAKDDPEEWTDFRVVLTPHCHLTIQDGETAPRADYVLTVRTLPAATVFSRNKIKKDAENLRRAVQSPSQIGKPAGRYWFLPGFLDIPDLLCDFLQLESIRYEKLMKEYKRVAMLDAPFAEALQACYSIFYATVGLPTLNAERFRHLLSDDGGAAK